MQENDSSVNETNFGDSNFKAEAESLSGFRDSLGFSVTEWQKDFCALTVLVGDQHMNRNGFVHGGVLMALIDSASGLCGTWCSVSGNVRKCITVSMSTHFINPVQDGLLRIEARMISRGRKMFFVEARITLEEQLIATGAGTFRYVLGGDNEEGVPLS